MTHPSRVLNLDIKARLCMAKSYISLQTVLFRPSGPHQCMLFWGSEKAWATRRSVSFRGLIQNFSRASSPLSYASPPTPPPRLPPPGFLLISKPLARAVCIKTSSNQRLWECVWRRHFNLYTVYLKWMVSLADFQPMSILKTNVFHR